MADWKRDKDRGPWPFTPQYNKWAYLNNPRWLDAPRQFVKGGPDDYDGRESEEPQIWTPEVIPPYPSNSFPNHHQCGHWHRPVGGSLIPIIPCRGLPCEDGYTYYSFAGYGSELGLNHYVGAYTDIGHTLLVPNTHSQYSVDNYTLVKLDLPPGDYVYYWWSHNVTETFWQADPIGTYNLASGIDKYFHSFTWSDAYGEYISAGIIWDFFYKGTLLGGGYEAINLGLYTKSGDTYSLIPGTLVSTPTWSVTLSPSLFTYAVPDIHGDPVPSTIIYLGVLYEGNPQRQYYTYAFFAEEPIHVQWVGSLGGSDVWSVFLDAENPPIPLCNCDFNISGWLAAVPYEIDVGESSTLTWHFVNADTVTIDNGIGSVGPNGSVVVSPTEDTQYIATAHNEAMDFLAYAAVWIAAAPPAPEPAGVWAYWKMEETSGNRVDSSGNNHYGVPTGTVGYESGKVNNAATFQASSYLEINGNPNLASDALFTIPMWVKIPTMVSGYCLLMDGDIQIYAAKGAGDPKVHFEVYANDRYLETAKDYDMDAYHLLILEYDGSAVTLYVNDVQAAQDVGSPGIVGSYGYLYIGSNDTRPAMIDEAGIWIGAWTPAERTDFWNSGAGKSYFS